MMVVENLQYMVVQIQIMPSLTNANLDDGS